jgi:hypothetical protein
MKLSASTLLLFISCALYSQQVINLGQDVMGTFSSGDTECYELTIEEAGEYVLTYNLWDATITVSTSGGQQLYTDYMATFSQSPKEQLLSLSPDVYQICFARGGETSMYQCRIVKKSQTPGDPVPLEYGDYATKELSVDGIPATYFFNGSTDEKIRIGFSTIFGVNIRISTPSETILYDQSFQTPPSDGLKLEFDLEETGKYLVAITPLNIYLQFSISLYLVEPAEAEYALFNESYGSTLVNFGLKYYRFTAYEGDTLRINYSGSTAGISIDVISPVLDTIKCDENIGETTISQSIIIDEDGTYLIVIDSDLQGLLSYGLSIDINPEEYEPGTLIIKERGHLYNKPYSFFASSDDLLRIGLNLPSKRIQLKDPDGTVIYELDMSGSPIKDTLSFTEIRLEKTGEYLLTPWHDFAEYSPVIMKFCASVVPVPQTIESDHFYEISVPPYQRWPYSFEAVPGQVFRFGFPDSSLFAGPGINPVIVNRGTSYLIQQSGTYIISANNYCTDSLRKTVWVNTIVPPADAAPVEIGQVFDQSIEMFEAPSIVYNGLANDTIFVQGKITEYLLTTDLEDIIYTPCWLYITLPSGKVLRTEGIPTASAADNGYHITYSLNKAMVLDRDGDCIITACLDKEVTVNQTDLWLRIDKEIEQIEVPFGTCFDYEMPGTYVCSVPEGLEELYVIVKKNTNISSVWRGFVVLKYGDQSWHSREEYSNRTTDDIIFQVNQPVPGLYMLPIVPDIYNNEILGSILFSGQLPEVQMNEWSSGTINRSYGSDWKMLETDNQFDTLYFMTEGYGLHSTIRVTYNHLVDFEQAWYFDRRLSGYNIEGKIANAPAGRYYIRYTDSAILTDEENQPEANQSRTYLLYTGSALSENSALLTLREVSAHELGTGKASVTLSGSGFSSVNSVNLISQEGQPTISMNILNVTDDGRELIAGYDFSDVTPGLYYLELQRADTLIRYSRNIEILPILTAGISSSILTSGQYRLGRNQKCIIRITNDGTIDIPYAAGYFYTSSDDVSVLITDTPGSEYELDSINAVLQDYEFTLMPFFIENLRVGEQADFIYNIFSSTVSTDDTFQVGYIAGVLNDSLYYSIRDTMATDWYNFLISSDVTPDEMKAYLVDITLTGFIDIWNSHNQADKKGVQKGSTKSIDETAIENGTEKFYSVLDKLPGKLPFKIPYEIVRAGVGIAWKTTKKSCNRLKQIKNFLDSLNDDSNPDENPDEYFEEEEVTKYPINSSTPEDKYGPAGYCDESGNKYIDSLKIFEYRIDYWNKEDATAPAAIVYIRDTIDTGFDLKTFRFTEFGFLKWKFKLDGGQYFDVNVDCRPDMPYIVNVEGTVDHNTREVFWVHTTLDPGTMELPDDPMSGYLPPIDSTGYQIGWVNYTVRPEGELKHGVSVENQAFVNFDGVGPWGPAPPYGPYTNIFDLSPPSSYVETLNPVQTELTFSINLNGEDQGSGIGRFDIYVSKDYEEPLLWKRTEETVVEFTGEDGARYEFHSIATDRVGNRENIKGIYDTYTVIDTSTTGIEKPNDDSAKRLQILPNPNNGVFRIVIEGFSGNGFLKIVDMSGRIIYDNEYVIGGYVNLEYLESGIYFLNFRCNDTTYYSKVTIY